MLQCVGLCKSVSQANEDHEEEWEVRDVCSGKSSYTSGLPDGRPLPPLPPLQPMTLVKISPGSLYNTVRLPYHLNLPSLTVTSTRLVVPYVIIH